MILVRVRVKVIEWPPFGKKLLIRLNERFLCIMFICNFKLVVSHFSFRRGPLVVIVIEEQLLFHVKRMYTKY